MDFKIIQEAIKELRFLDGLSEVNEVITTLKEKNSFTYLKEFLQTLTEDKIYILIRLFDRTFMPGYSSFLAKYAHHRFNTLQTLSWYCDELSESGRGLEAEELLKEAINDSIKENISPEILERCYYTLIRILLDLHRYDEAKQYITKLEKKYATYNYLGYYYWRIGDQDTAVTYFQQGLEDTQFGYLNIFSLIDLYNDKGEYDKAKQLISEGLERYPQIPYFYLKNIHMKMYEKQFELIPQLVNDFHKMLIHHQFTFHLNRLIADSYFYQNKLEVLASFIQQHEELKELPYANLIGNEDKKHVTIPLTTVIQKHNYCVPASLQMMLDVIGYQLTQDEIGKHIFHRTGTSLARAVQYLEELGNEVRWFVGSIEIYKKLINNGLPIMVSISLDHSAHVQIVCGYDDRLQCLVIQDPNFHETTFLPYEAFKEHYFNTGFQSIVVTKKEQSHLLADISKEDTTFFKKLFSFSTILDKEFLAFLREHEHYLYTKLFIINHSLSEMSTEYVLSICEMLLREYPKSDYVKLHVAQCFYELDEEERTKALLAETTTKSSLYHSLYGRIAQDEGRFKEMLRRYRKAVQLDPDEAFLWGYLALSYFYNDKLAQALEKSTIAIKGDNQNPFILLTHARILIAHNHLEEGRKLLTEAIKLDKYIPQVWYERAQCDKYLGRYHQASRGYKVAIHLEPNVALAHLALAELYEDDEEKYERILLDSLRTVTDNAQIPIQLGDFYFKKEDYNKAKAMFQKAIDWEKDGYEQHIGYALCLEQLEGMDSYQRYLLSIHDSFKQEPDYLRTIGRNFIVDGQRLKNNADIEKGITYFEESLLLEKEEVGDDIEGYIDLIEETGQWERGKAFLHQLFNKYPLNVDVCCFLGYLYERAENIKKALLFYQKATTIEKTTFPYYRLGEVYTATNDYNKAKKAYQTCLEIEPTLIPAIRGLLDIAEEEKNTSDQYRYSIMLVEIEPLIIHPRYLAKLACIEQKTEALLTILQSAKGNVYEIWRLDALAYLYGEIGDIDKELQYVLKALEIEEEAIVLIHLIEIYIKQHNYANALHYIEEILPNELENDYLADLWLICLGSYKNAVKYIKNYSDHNEDRSDLYLFLSNAIERYFANLEEEDEESPFTILLDEPLNVTEQHIAKCVAESYAYNENNEDSLLKLTWMMFETGEMKTAKKLLRNYLKKQFDSMIALQLMSINAHTPPFPIDEMKEAELLGEQILQEDEENLDCLRLLGHAKLQLKKYNEAQDLLQQCLDIDPAHSPYVYTLYGNFYIETKQFDEAVHILEEGLNYFPEDETVLAYLGYAYSNIADFPKAIEFASKSLTIDPINLNNRYNRACYLSCNNQIEEAIEDLQLVFEEEKDKHFFNFAKDDPDLENVRNQVSINSLRKRWKLFK
ncbi:MAG: tetratricopeptide repeat protein [Bacillaceae bacterium]